MKVRLKEKNKRNVFGKTPFSSNGMNAEELRNKLVQTSSKTKKITSDLMRPRREVSRDQITNKRIRPVKQEKDIHIEESPVLLIDVPSVGTKLSVLYPTPEWFLFKEKADVSVVVPLYKSEKVVKDLIESWQADNDGLNVELIFVDDHCPNNTKNLIVQYFMPRKHEFPKGIGKLVFNTQNKGYGEASNTGAEYATGDYIIYLNADTKVTKGWIKPIYEAFVNDSKVGIVGNMQLKEGGMWHDTIDGVGSQWIWKEHCFVHIGRHCYEHKLLPYPWKPVEAPKDILVYGEREMVTGCCLAIRADLNKEIGGFNPNYRVGYWEDSDLCLTVREKGWKVVCEPNSVIYHKLGHTNSGNHSHHNFNQNYFWNKWVNSGRIDNLVKDKREHKKEIKSILLQRKGARGDVLVASYVANALKKKYPDCKIGFFTKSPEVLQNNPNITKVFSEVSFSERQFQLIYNLDMVYEFRPYSNILQCYADAVGVNIDDCVPFIGKEEFDIPYNDYVVVHAGSTNWVGRNWLPQRFEQIAKKLIASGKNVVCIGTLSDNLVSSQIDLRGKTNIGQLASVIEKAEAFIGIDSFPFHIAQAVNTKGVCFFGSIQPETRIYRDNMKSVSVNNLSCLGCHHRQPKPSVVTNICQTGTHACVNDLSVDFFWSKIEEVL